MGIEAIHILQTIFIKRRSSDKKRERAFNPTTTKYQETNRDNPLTKFIMPIIHIILFEFHPTVTHAQVEDVCHRMLALKDTCIHPTTQKPYVKSYGGGRDNSPEGLQVVVFLIPPFHYPPPPPFCTYTNYSTLSFG